MKTLFSLALLLCCLSCFAGTNPTTGWVSLSWSNSPSPTVTETRIYYGVTTGTYTNFLSVPMPQNTCSVSNLACGFRYYFVAVASDGVDEAPPSNEVNAKIRPAKATALTVTGSGN